MGVNRIFLIGHLGHDASLRETERGAVARISLATSEAWKDKNGEKHERTEWHRVVFFGRLAEIAGEYLKKGMQVYVGGRLQTRKWTDKDGNERHTTEIVASDMQMLDKRDRSQDREESTERTTEGKSARTVREDFNDDIPFGRSEG